MWSFWWEYLSCPSLQEKHIFIPRCRCQWGGLVIAVHGNSLSVYREYCMHHCHHCMRPSPLSHTEIKSQMGFPPPALITPLNDGKDWADRGICWSLFLPCFHLCHILPNFHIIVSVNSHPPVIFYTIITMVFFLITPHLINGLPEDLLSPPADTIIYDSNHDNKRLQRKEIFYNGLGGEGVI